MRKPLYIAVTLSWFLVFTALLPACLATPTSVTFTSAVHSTQIAEASPSAVAITQVPATSTFTPILLPTATSTLKPATPSATPTSTPEPTEILFPTFTPPPDIDGIYYYDLSPNLVALLKGADHRLNSCAPDLWNYVHNQIAYLEGGFTTTAWEKYRVTISSDTFNWAEPYDLNEFWAMYVLVHEARHIEQPGQGRDEPDANRYGLKVFDACGSTVQPENRARLEELRQYVESLTH